MKNIVKYIKVLCLLSIMSLSTILSFAKTDDSVLTRLQAKTWEMQGLTDKTYEDKYMKKHIVSSLNGQHLCSFEFYLSDSIITLFDQEKVGKVDNGRYIISRMVRDKDDTRPTPIQILEIIELDDDKMMLKNIRTNIVLEYRAK